MTDPTPPQPCGYQGVDAQDPYGDDCSRVMEQLDAYLHAPMPDHERHLLARHLQRCAGCTCEADSFDAQQRLLGLLQRCCGAPTPAPLQLRERVVAVLGQMSTVQVSRTTTVWQADSLTTHVSLTHTELTLYPEE